MQNQIRLTGMAAIACAFGGCHSVEEEARWTPEYFTYSATVPTLGDDENTGLGLAHLVRGDYGLAETYYRRAVEALPWDSSAWRGLAQSYEGLGRHDLAERARRQADDLERASHVSAGRRAFTVR